MKKRLLTQGCMAGMKKIGFITPSSNTALEPITSLMLEKLSDVVSVHIERLPVQTLTLDSHDVAQFQADKMTNAALLLKDAGVDIILWNGTSGGWTGEGLQADREICRRITAATGIAASTTSLAQVEAFQCYGMTRYGLAVPYEPGPTEMMLKTYRAEGFEGVSHAMLSERVNTVIGALPFERIRQLLLDADSPQAQCLMVGCTNLPATVLLDEIEAKLGKPVFDSIAVTLWKALRMSGIDRPIHGWGMLLRRHPVLERLDALMESLREEVGTARTTIRLDVPRLNIGADDVYAESVAAGIPPLKLDSSLNQRALGTVQWLEKHRRCLIQADCVNAETPPPKALMSVYGVTAQMLAPLVWNDEVMGWISVHHIGGTRAWKESEIALLDAAASRAKEILEAGGWAPAGAGVA
ncbi:hypothetical protein BAU07_14050 [Bordetella flabilis]|uniref:GAF domain-containing protein n=2 Tax=Bordetella flabilis TaxID=463014 RepID=A0A193GDF4_9BORD|nr:hypothetical protein BAU07_14050 [Bordetella flabilis]